MDKNTFIEAFNKHKDSRFTKFMFSTFSKESKSVYKKILDIFLLSLFCIMFLMSVLGVTGIAFKVLAIIFMVVFFGFIGSFFYASFAKNANIRKVCRDLDISIKGYENYYQQFIK